MVSKSELVKMIQKLADVPKRSVGPKAAPAKAPAGVPAKAPAPGGSAAPASGGGTYVNATPAIREMQKAMQDFAQSATPPPVKPGQPAVADPNKPFNDFIAEQYLATSDIHGSEFSTVKEDVKKQDKKPTDIMEMQVVLETLQRIGSQSSELKADSLWDWRTNNALKNIYAFADALIRITKDFGKTNAKSFNDNDLKKMRENIPGEKNPKLSNQDKLNRAKVLTPLIEKLTNFYQYYVKAIATHPGYSRFISGKIPYAKFTPGGKDDRSLTDAEKKLNPAQSFISGSYVPVPLNLYNNKMKQWYNVGQMPLSVFTSMDDVNKQLQNQGYEANEITPVIQKDFLKSILAHINAVLAQYAAPPVAAPPPAPAAPPTT